MENVAQLKKILSKSTKVAVFGHEYIDGDALGSILAFGRVLHKLGKKVEYFTTVAPSRTFAFLKAKNVKTEFKYGKYDCVFFLDFTPYERIPAFTKGHEDYFDAQTRVIIDHHPVPHPKGECLMIDTTASSNCELLYEIIMKIDPKLIDEEVATYLLLGTITDTGNFTYEKDSQRTLKIAADLVKRGARKKRLVDNLMRSKSLASVQFMSVLFGRIQQQDDVLWTYFDEHEIKKYGLEKEEAEAGMGIVTTIKDVGMYVLCREVAGLVRVSLRSQGKVDVSALAQKFG